ncbi:MAG: GGDEF domain-containing protein, partial [Cobetia crustatorum]
VSMAERLRQQIAALEFRFKTLKLRCTISMGVASPEPGESREAYLHRADMALYSAKRSGRNRVILASHARSEDN